MKARIILEWDNEVQAYSATCPELNFISSCGDTKEEAIENIKDAITLMFSPIPNNLLNNNNNKIENIELIL